MDVSTFIFVGALAALALYGVTLYNNLVSLKHNVDKAWSNIDVLLKQRHDELPKLVETCKQYMQYEQDTHVLPWPPPANKVILVPWDRPRPNLEWGWAACLRWQRLTPI